MDWCLNWRWALEGLVGRGFLVVICGFPCEGLWMCCRVRAAEASITLEAVMNPSGAVVDL